VTSLTVTGTPRTNQMRPSSFREATKKAFFLYREKTRVLSLTTSEEESEEKGEVSDPWGRERLSPRSSRKSIITVFYEKKKKGTTTILISI